MLTPSPPRILLMLCIGSFTRIETAAFSYSNGAKSRIPSLRATSSRDLKDQGKRYRAKQPRRRTRSGADISASVRSLALSRASKVDTAAPSLEAIGDLATLTEVLDEQLQNKKRRTRTGADISASVRSLALSRAPKVDTAAPSLETIGDLATLTEVLDERLQNKKLVSGTFKQSRDSFGSLVGYNEMADMIKKPTQHEIVVLFGKNLMNDQVTVEYASRLRALAQLVDDASFQPDLICFCGGIRNKNYVSNADAGFLFFKQLCAKQNISLEGIDFFVDRTSSQEGMALKHVAQHVLKHHVSEWLAISQDVESHTDEYGIRRRSPRKKVHLHFSLVSTEYHLFNLNDIHQRSPNQSPLRPIEMLRTKDRSHDEDEDDDYTGVRRESASQKSRTTVQGILDCSWSYKYATYPYSYTSNEASAFMGRCYLLGKELKPLLVNLKGVVSEREFLQRDNYITAASIRHELVGLVEDLYKTTGIRSGLRELTSEDSSRETVDIVLEGATLALGRAVDLVRPAGLHQSSVSKQEYSKAMRWLGHCMKQIQIYCDPDQPLDPAEWGTMETYEEIYTEGEGI